jgi:hypothetical protein
MCDDKIYEHAFAGVRCIFRQVVNIDVNLGEGV